MKKGLLSLLGAASFATAAFATGDAVELYAPYMDSVNQYYSVKLDVTNRKLGLSGLTNDATAKLWQVATWGKTTAVDQTATIEGNALVVTSKRTGVADNWQDITLAFTDWVGGTLIKYGPEADTMVGMFVDLTGNVVMSAKCETNVECEVRIDLIDANGNISNSMTPRAKIKPGAADYYQFEFNEDSLMNWYGGDQWGTQNGRNNPSELKKGDKIVSLPAAANVPVDVSKIVKIAIVVNDAGQGILDEVVNLKISELVIGEQKNPTPFIAYDPLTTVVPFTAANCYQVPYPSKFTVNGGTVPTFLNGAPVSEGSVSAASELVVYPNPAKGQITVNETVTVTTLSGTATGVAGTGVLDISKLLKGSYLVVGTTGTTTLVVE